MFKIVRHNCCGLDVHKSWIYACIGIPDAFSRTEYIEARFQSFPKDLHRLTVWLQKYDCKEICMESAASTGSPSSISLSSPARLSSKMIQTRPRLFLLDLYFLPSFGWFVYYAFFLMPFFKLIFFPLTGGFGSITP